jgi:tRNA nucleotidyltransferase/poly(A) polymerase
LKHEFYFLKFAETKILFNIFEKNGIEARFVGGCVRDAILNLKTDDLDLAVNVNILNIKRILEQNGIKCFDTGLKYGSITAIVHNRKFEITSLRTDLKCFGRDCEISCSTSFEEDAKRRDFTINALYLSKSGELFDYFGGVEDLKNRVIKFIGNPHDRIKEDYLRIFRYYRFCSKLGDLSNKYHDVIRSEIQGIKILSIERIQKELFSILQSKYAQEIIKLMNESGVLQDIKINDLAKITQCDKLELKLYLIFELDYLLNVLRLTKLQKTVIKNYQKFQDESLLYCLYKKGAEFAQDIALIKSLDIANIATFSKSLPKFPISFHDLPEGVRYASKKIEECEKWWVNNNFKKSKKECLKFISLLEIPR